MKGPGMMQGPGMGDSESESDDGMPPPMLPGPAVAQQRRGLDDSGSESGSEYSGAPPPPQTVHHGEGLSVLKPVGYTAPTESSMYGEVIILY
jgi:hypothetical protein